MANMMQDKVIVITGGFGNLAGATGDWLRARGAQVELVDAADEPSNPLPSGIHARSRVDLNAPGLADAVMSEIARDRGGIDGLVNIAGGFRWDSVLSGGLDSWDAMYRINLRTAVAATKAALPMLMQSRGSIVNIGAVAAARGSVGMGPYAASKSGVARFTEALAEEVKDTGVIVNAVLPSIIDTPQNRQAMPSAEHGRWVSPHSIAAVVGFLLSREAVDVTGASIPVRGRL